MRITHRRLERSENIIEMKTPITKLKISDPWYKKNVWCRYENDHFPSMRMMIIFLNTECIDVPEHGFDFKSEEYIIRLVNHYAISGDPNEEKEFEIGVDTAKYEIETNCGYDQILTLSDGGWGQVTERYFKGKLGEIEIRLTVPDDAMTKEEFLDSIKRVFGIVQDIEFKVITDEDINIEICDDKQNMKTSIVLK